MPIDVPRKSFVKLHKDPHSTKSPSCTVKPDYMFTWNAFQKKYVHMKYKIRTSRLLPIRKN